MDILNGSIEKVISNYKYNLHKLYRLAEAFPTKSRENEHTSQYKFVCGQEKILELLFGSEFVEKLTNEAWDEYYELTNSSK
jgi:hypothetical protein